jgi:hypothetical protein
MSKNMNKSVSKILIIGLGLIIMSCSKNNKSNDGSVLEKKRIDPNVDRRMEAARDAGGGIFNSSRSTRNNTFEFSSSNVLWRASLDSLKSVPLANVDYSGGVILTDWYSSELNSKESIKIKIEFKSNELSASSVEVVSHKKVCLGENCQITSLSEDFNLKIKNTILEKARFLEIQKNK